ncbi:hypothetical protein F4802DRAFT_551378 [Xylaria palmicola]|nr:hypothetical protein F4802DRAFT_551378 [Xylaria palmicola]
MGYRSNLLLLLSASLLGAQCTDLSVPYVHVPSCSKGIGRVQYNKSVLPNETFPPTQVDLCYTDSDVKISFIAFEEDNFFYNESYKTNDPIYEYEVMEAFIYHGSNDPQSYFEFEVSPNNVTWQAFIYNPSKVRADKRPFDHGQLADPIIDGLVSNTVLDKGARTWISNVSIPLGLFNIDDGQARGTQWRMNFFRTVVSKETFPDQLLGAWSPTGKASFHITPYFGNVFFA